MRATVPGVLWPSGSVIDARWPGLILSASVASSWATTCRRVEVASRIGLAGVAPGGAPPGPPDLPLGFLELRLGVWELPLGWPGLDAGLFAQDGRRRAGFMRTADYEFEPRRRPDRP